MTTTDPGPTYLEQAAAELGKARADNDKRREIAAIAVDGDPVRAVLILADTEARSTDLAGRFTRLAATAGPGWAGEGAAILYKALESAENRAMRTDTSPEGRQELLEARLRVAEGFARLQEASLPRCCHGAQPEPEPQP
jgi:hypothetical protein